MKRRQRDRIVVAYAGGFEATAALRWLAETSGAELVTMTLDLGQGADLTDVRDRALAAGAARAHVIDARDEFANEFILRALHAGVFDGGRDPLASALSRPIIAKHLAAIARIEDTFVVAHGCAADEDRLRMVNAIRSVDPALEAIVPIREWEISPAELVEYARQRGIPVPSSSAAYEIAANFWARSLSSCDRDDPWAPVPEEMYLLTKAAADAPENPAIVEIEFDAGTPVSINGVPMSFSELIQSLATIAGAHGVGRIEFVEPGPEGAPRRRILEAPAAVTLQTALRELQSFMTPRELHALSAEMSAKYIALVIEGTWFSPAREALDAFVATASRAVAGTVRLKLDKGVCQVAEVQPRPLLSGPPHTIPQAH